MNKFDVLLNVISIAIECSMLIYYSNAVMCYRHSRIKSNLTIVIGYSIYLGICMLQIPMLNVICFVLVNFLVIYYGFEESIGSTLFKTITLSVLMMFTELLAAVFINVKIEYEAQHYMTYMENIIFSLSSKILYCSMLILLRRISVSKHRQYKAKETFLLLFLPVCTCIFLVVFNKILPSLDIETEIMCITLSILMLFTNFIVYVVCDSIVDKNQRIQELQAIEFKREIDFKSYNLLKEKYADLKIMVHDFNKYCQNIEGMLGEHQDEAKSLIRTIEDKNKEFLLVEYTNNRALNILLSQKLEECNNRKIDFQIYIQDIDLSFISEFDTVSIFANLMDNAIESCENSRQKKIFLSICDMNNAYAVIRVDNSADKKPISRNNTLVTGKKNNELHGIGMASIRQTLDNYNSKMKWSYNKESRVFSTTIIINYFIKSNKN